ncbi:hypothetical protein SDC9_149558 [bioreactor metagenome]|jgi:uncharacterized spore protein YtfJ|uniref:Spore protein YtfJ n=2 Tax=root TaxID=1 RepID=A0A645EM34_9ZZZZ|nr:MULTISPECIES: hypothetical protein [Sedimentibacter]MEA5094362.1 hypothetical protein [Sedimentibacter saalensis]TWH82421.1 putative spore protein YtfJ [Sedimentibacter saalensis]
MSNDIESIIKTTLDNINNLTENEKLISSKINYDNTNYLAISKLNMNFVIGGSDIDKKFRSVDLKPFAGAAYVNLQLNPQVLIYESPNKDVRTININNETTSTDLTSSIMNIMTFIKDVREKKESEI